MGIPSNKKQNRFPMNDLRNDEDKKKEKEEPMPKNYRNKEANYLLDKGRLRNIAKRGIRCEGKGK